MSAPVPGALPVPAATAGFNEDLAAVIPRLRRYARVLTGNSTRGDDLVQDTLARAWEKHGYWRPGSDLRAWLFTIMHNVFVNQLAAAKRDAKNVSLDEQSAAGTTLQFALEEDPTRRIEVREVMQQVQRLPAEQRAVLMLVAVEGMRYDEVAATLEIPVGTVMSRLSRARDKLKRMALQPLPALKAAGERGAHGCRDETNETKQACLGFPVSLFASVNTLQLASFPKQSMSSNPGNHSGKAAHEFRQAKS